ncbi:TIGR00266 family protein [Halodesulfurarchaeum sp. HSR-GB]|uniref:TIGR00266 family protein n=1 Tax=Halodesulfurarchaeum sp. HSR-GB TaxID=3074077 RepID=UPI00285A39E3|nr:TIGR00266 family protein [Halodesulfurarchaeum sp. HSR-GB]MDR5656971.1 TIGR00266 family protein [Halodesulfurarchaeum sp. HSR-GB]
MQTELTHRPSFTHLIVDLDAGESIRAEPGALVGHSETIHVETTTSRGGLLSSAKSMLGGESMFANEFVAEDGPGRVTFAPGTPGDVMEHELTGETLYAADGAFLAATPGIDIDSELGGLKSVLGEAGLTPLALKGTGSVFIDAYGGLERIDLDPGESYVLDNEHLIAWDSEIDFSTRTVGGLKSTLLGGEGLVFEFTGPGTAWYQTRDLDAFVSSIAPRLPNDQ